MERISTSQWYRSTSLFCKLSFCRSDRSFLLPKNKHKLRKESRIRKIRQKSTMTKQDVIETVETIFEDVDTRSFVNFLEEPEDLKADYEAAKYLFGDQDPESDTLEDHEDLLKENEKLLLEYYKKQSEEFFAEWNEGNLLLIMARDLKSITSKITKSGLNITEILERTKRIYGNVRDRYFDGDRTEDIVWFLNFITSGEPTKGNYGHVPVKIMHRCLRMYKKQGYVNGSVEVTERLASLYNMGPNGRKKHLDYILDILDPDCTTTAYHCGLAEWTIIGKMFAKDRADVKVDVEKLIEDFDILFNRSDEEAIREVLSRWKKNLTNGCEK